MRLLRLIVLSLATSSMLLLAACESDTEKAERFYQSGLALAEQGDNERALIELRNVFQHDGFHREARNLYARLSLELDRPQEAYSQYLRLIEQYPDAIEARVALAQMAIVNAGWDEVERHTVAAVEQAPERTDVQALDVIVKYRHAALNKDTTAQAALAEQAIELLRDIRATQETGDNYGLVRIVLSHLTRSGPPQDALPVLEEALARDPGAEDLNVMKVQLLEQSGDIAGAGAQLRKMITLFPENSDIQQAMVNWYLVQDDIAGAEAFLRDRAGADDGPTEGHVAVIQLLAARVSSDAARAEIERLVETNTGNDQGRFYAAMLALQDFEAGQTDTAITNLRTLIGETESPARKIDMQLLLAQMLIATDNAAEADGLIAAVLAVDAGNVGALKMQASRLIDNDQPGAAIIALRRALGQNPRDAETLTIMARAHQRDGDVELAGERLALAVEVSGSGAAEAIRYARFLTSQNQSQVAATVLEDARRNNPRDPQIMALLGSIALENGAWQQAQEMVVALRALDSDENQRIATELQAAILQGQNRIDDSLSVLEAQVGNSDDPTGAERIRAVMLIEQTQIRAGKTEAARSYLDTAMQDLPASPDLKVLDATVSALMGDMETAETGYRALIAEYPLSFLPVRLLINVLNSTGDTQAAEQVLQEALERMPDNAEALLLMAGNMERSGDVTSAIETYEKIYAQDSGNLVVANNLASLISTFRDDEENLTRAAGIARRLRGTQVPAFQDTYGWISYRRGDLDEALDYLAPAAESMPTNPLVRFHLGMTYAALGRTQEATANLTRALELGEGRNLQQQMQTARDTLATLQAAPAD